LNFKKAKKNIEIKMVVIDEIHTETNSGNAKKEDKAPIEIENVEIESKEEPKETSKQESIVKDEINKQTIEVKSNDTLSKFTGPRLVFISNSILSRFFFLI
jgi:hypothetical protein